MSAIRFNLKPIVAALFAIVMFSLPVVGQGAGPAPSVLDQLYDSLATASPADAKGLEREIRLEWRKTGSPAMDLLLKRGREALERGEFDVAIEHLTALTDHAPDFAEGFHYAGAGLFPHRTDRSGAGRSGTDAGP